MILQQKLDNLKNDYEKSVMNYLEFFCIKQQCEFDYWVADQIGTIAAFGDNFFSLDNIRFDIDNEIEKGVIYEWQYHCIEKEVNINYENYIKGLR